MRPPGKQQGRAAPRLTLAAATLAAAGLLAVLCFAAARPEPEPQPAWRQRGDAFPTRQPAANATATLTLQPTAAAAGAATAPAPGQLRLASEPLHPRARAPTLVVYVYGGRDAGGLRCRRQGQAEASGHAGRGCAAVLRQRLVAAAGAATGRLRSACCRPRLPACLQSTPRTPASSSTRP